MKGRLQLNRCERLEMQALLQHLEASRRPVNFQDPAWASRTWEHGLYTEAARDAGRWHELIQNVLNQSTSQ